MTTAMLNLLYDNFHLCLTQNNPTTINYHPPPKSSAFPGSFDETQKKILTVQFIGRLYQEMW